MGKITTTGYSTREVEVDVMAINMHLRVYESKNREAIKKGEKMTEEILKLLKDLGADISQVESEGQTVKRDRSYIDDRVRDVYEYSRELRLKAKADIKLANRIMSYIRKDGMDVSVSISYEVSNIEEIRKELKMEALKDARVKADAMAEVLGEEVLDAYSIDGYANFTFNERKSNRKYACMDVDLLDSETPLADEMGIEKKKEYESVEVVWNIRNKKDR